MPLSAGTRLGPYEIDSSLGAGGMGEVYKARDTRLNRDVAIKVLPESFAQDAERLRRFQLEAQSAGALNHPNILAIHDIGTFEQSPYLVSELLEGESLRDRLQRGKIGVNKAVDYARQIAAGLAAAHSKGIIHRDIKPENLFITRDGRVKILDFGLAKISGERARNDLTHTVTSTTPGMVMGTAAYMSPEQARGQMVDHRSDIFSFGCVLYEMLTGERAFTGNTQADVMSAILTKEPELAGKMPPGLARIVQHCIEKSPEERLQSARDIVFALEAVTQQDSSPQPAAIARKQHWLVYLLAASLLSTAVFAFLYFRPAPHLSFHRLTFRRGNIHAARFTTDGGGVVYSAQWEDEPSEVFTARFDSVGSRSLGFAGYTLQAISHSGELALAQNRRIGGSPFGPIAMLTRAPFSGGAARAVEDNIAFADWSPDGKEMAVVRETDRGVQLEYPAGKVIYSNAGYISEPRISPDGQRVAFMDHPLSNDNGGTVAVVDRSGSKKTLSAVFAGGQGLAWSPKGDEVWFTAAVAGARFELQAVTLSGRQRVVYSTPGGIVLRDIWKDGRVLLTGTEQRTKLMFRGAGDSRERELSWLDWSLLDSLSPDGKLVIFSESGEGAAATANGQTVLYLRETNGAPAVLLGPGNPSILSPDGQWVVSNDVGSETLLIYPVGPGQSKRIPMPGFTIGLAGLLPGGKEFWVNANQPSHGTRYFLMNAEGGTPRPVTPEGVRFSSPGAVLNGKYLAGRAGGRTLLYPVRGGEPKFLGDVSDQERIAGWSDDQQAVFVYSRNEYPTKVSRVDLKTGKQELIREITTSDRAGMNFGINVVQVTGDTKTYAYSFLQELSQLQLVEGLK